MSNAKEIRTKISSIQNTQKITRAMEMVAASKMRRAQDLMQCSRPYSEKIKTVMSHLAKGHPEYRHPYLAVRDLNRLGFIIVSSDRGLCGGLNNNLFKAVLQSMQRWQERGIELDICLIGSKALNFFSRMGGNVVAQAEHIGDNPSLNDLIGVIKVMLDAYDEQRLDGLFIAYNEFVNTMTQAPQVQQLLPIEPVDDESLSHYWDYIYEPDPKEVMDVLLKRYIESQVYQSVVENNACEQAARMVAMKSASDNAGTIIDDLLLDYNKARQAAITRELAEIVAGAEAV